VGFKEMVEAANKRVFLDTEKFADLRTVKYDGETYTDIPIILADVVEIDRRTVILQDGRRDNTQGLFMATGVLHCALSDLNGVKPEKGRPIQINYQEGGGGYFMEYNIEQSGCAMGMLRLVLEAIDE